MKNGKTYALRVTELEKKLIESFLSKNGMLDFSTMARAAILRFIDNPEITLNGVKTNLNAKRK